MNLRGLQTQAPVVMAFPDFDDNLRQAFRRETELLFASIVREDRSVLDLLTADYTFLNERLARHYGIPNVYGSQFRRVALGPEFDMRRGLLGQGSQLTVSSQPGRTSPVQRGKWFMQTFLGVSPPSPPPGVVIRIASTEKDAHGGTKQSMRQQMEVHRTTEPCKSCHKIMDPIGFTLETLRRRRRMAHGGRRRPGRCDRRTGGRHEDGRRRRHCARSRFATRRSSCASSPRSC